MNENRNLGCVDPLNFAGKIVLLSIFLLTSINKMHYSRCYLQFDFYSLDYLYSPLCLLPCLHLFSHRPHLAHFQFLLLCRLFSLTLTFQIHHPVSQFREICQDLLIVFLFQSTAFCTVDMNLNFLLFNTSEV